MTDDMMVVNDQIYHFQFGWKDCEHLMYAGEEIWVPVTEDYPSNAPVWISREDLLIVKGVKL